MSPGDTSNNNSSKKEQNQKIQDLEERLKERNERIQSLEKELKNFQETDKRYYNVIESSPWGIFIYQLEKKDRLVLKKCNDAAEKILSIKASSIIGKTIEEAFPGLIETVIPDSYRNTARTGKIFYSEKVDYDFDKIKGAYEVRAFRISPKTIAVAFLDITERVEFENDLRQNQYYLSKASEIGKIGTWELDILNNKLFWTRENYNIFGVIGDAEIDYETFLSMVHPEDKDYVNEKWKAGMSGEPYDIEHRVIADGKVKWVREKANVSFDKDGKAVSAIGFTQDITSIKESQLKLIENERKFRIMADNTSDWEYWLDQNNNYVFISPVCEQLTGFSAAEFKENPDIFFPLVREDYREQVVEHYKFENRKDSAHTSVFPIINKKGEELWLEHSCIPLFDDDGNFLGRRGNNRDITEQKKHENELIVAKEIAEQNQIELKLNESRLTALVELNQMKDESDDMIYDFTLSKAIELTQSDIGFLGFANETETEVKIYKWSEKAMKKCAVKDFDMNFIVEEAGLWGEVIRQRKAYLLNDYKKPHPLKKGFPEGHVAIRNYLSIPTLRDNKVIAILAVSNKKGDYIQSDSDQLTLLLDGMRRFLDERKEREELILAKQKAEESDRLKSAFLSNMSHEIRTPMNGILGFTNLLKRTNLSFENKEKYIDIISKSGNRLLDTVNDIIEVSKIESGEVSISLSEVNIYPFLDSLVSFFTPEAESKGLAMILNKDTEVTDISILTDEYKLNSILSNLLKNAIKYTDKGSICLGVNVDEYSINFTCQDTGIGVPENKYEAIFNRFEQADIDDKLAHEGSGLGLSIVKSYVEMLDGKVWLESREGEGSTFFVSLPI